MPHNMTTSRLFSRDILERANSLFDHAEQLADNEEILLRVKAHQAQCTISGTIDRA